MSCFQSYNTCCTQKRKCDFNFDIYFAFRKIWLGENFQVLYYKTRIRIINTHHSLQVSLEQKCAVGSEKWRKELLIGWKTMAATSVGAKVAPTDVSTKLRPSISRLSANICFVWSRRGVCGKIVVNGKELRLRRKSILKNTTVELEFTSNNHPI